MYITIYIYVYIYNMIICIYIYTRLSGHNAPYTTSP